MSRKILLFLAVAVLGFSAFWFVTGTSGHATSASVPVAALTAAELGPSGVIAAGAEETDGPIFNEDSLVSECEPSHKRACGDKCDGFCGMLCFYGTVCNPTTCVCEKTAP